METTDFSAELTSLKEVIVSLTNEVEMQKNSLAVIAQLPELLNHHMNESKQMWKEILEEVRSGGRAIGQGQTDLAHLTSKLVEGSNVYVIGMESVSQSQSSVAHDKSALFQSTKELEMEQASSLCHHQQDVDSKSDQCQYTKEEATTATQLTNEMHLAENLKLRQLVEAAARHVARANKMRGETERGETGGIAHDSSALLSASSNPDNQNDTHLGAKKGNLHSTDLELSTSISANTTTGWTPSSSFTEIAMRTAQFPIATSKRFSQIAPPEKLTNCSYCPRKFEHKHSIKLHMRSCKKKYLESARVLAVQQGKNISNDFDELTTTDQFEGSMKNNLNTGIVCVKRQFDRMIKCSHCERTFPTQHQVISHERIHTGVQPYSCYICSIKFAHGGNMIKHIKSKHPNHNPYVCRHCNSNFKTHTDVQHHRKECAPSRKSLANRNESSSQVEKQRKFRRESEETVTASEDESNVLNHPPSPTRLPPADGNHPQREYGAMLPSMPLLSIKQENDPKVSPSVVPNLFMANSIYSGVPATAETIATEVDIHTTYDETGANSVQAEVTVNQFDLATLASIKTEVELLPD